MLNNAVNFPNEFGSTEKISQFKTLVKKTGGSSNFAYTVAGRTHKGTKISLEVFSTDIRKRLVKNVS